MHAEDFLVDDGGYGEAVKAICEGFPKFDVVTSLALVVETIYAVDGRALVVSSQNKKVFGILNLVRQQQADGFQRLFPSIDVITAKE